MKPPPLYFPIQNKDENRWKEARKRETDGNRRFFFFFEWFPAKMHWRTIYFCLLIRMDCLYIGKTTKYYSEKDCDCLFWMGLHYENYEYNEFINKNKCKLKRGA